MGIKTQNGKIVQDAQTAKMIESKERALQAADEHPVYNGISLAKLLGISSMCVYKWMGDDADFNQKLTEKFKRNKEICNKSWLNKSDVLWDSVFAAAQEGCIKSTGYAVNISKTIKESLDEDFKKRQEIDHKGNVFEGLLDALRDQDG